jgi:RHS repeat-associated protein
MTQYKTIAESNNFIVLDKFTKYLEVNEAPASYQTEALPIRATDQIYYYHPDHLGTATYLTDGNGLPYEFFLNLPFGETMAEQHSQTADYENRYKFTGHELDRETGLYYAGARYYDPKISIWLSVDPLLEKFPNFNPYNYVMQNPIKLIDPTGLSPEETENGNNSIDSSTDNQTDPIKGIFSAGITYTFDSKKFNFNISAKLEQNLSTGIDNMKTDVGVKFSFNTNLEGKKLTFDTGITVAANGSTSEGAFNFKGSAESSANYNFNENKLTANYFKSKLSVENKISDNNYNSVTTSLGIGFDAKKGTSIFGQSYFSNTPSGLNPSAGRNVTLGLNYNNFKSITTIAKEAVGAKYDFYTF